MEDERCDEESVVFNARVNEDEMIIAIEEYENLKKEIEYLKSKDDEQFNLRQRIRDENMALKEENATLQKENTTLRRGIIKFVKLIGGLTSD